MHHDTWIYLFNEEQEQGAHPEGGKKGSPLAYKRSWNLQLEDLRLHFCLAENSYLHYFEISLYFRLGRVLAHFLHVKNSCTALYIYFKFPLFGSFIYCLFGSQLHP